MAAFVDGRLEAPARVMVASHLAACEVCQAVCSERASRSPARRRRLRWLCAGTGVAAVLALSVWTGRQWLAANARVQALLRTVMTASAERPLEGRVSGDRSWRPYSPSPRGAAGRAEFSPDVLIALARIDRAIAGERTAATLSAFGKGRLLIGQPQAAIEALEETVALGAASADLWSDLAAGFLARANDAERAADLPRALDSIDRAIALDGARPEFWFNKALILERLALVPEAIAAWDRFLAVDASSPWTKEARDRLARLRQAGPKGSDAQPLRDRLFDVVLPAWAQAATEGASQPAAARLDEARRTVAAIAGLTADRYVRDVLAATERSASSADVRRGLTALGRGREAFAADDFESAIAGLDEAERRLSRVRHPLALFATVYRAIVAYRRNDFDGAHRLLLAIRPEAVRRDYAGLVGRIDWTRGLMLLLAGHVRDSAECYASAIDALNRAGERENRAFVVGLMATNYDRIGDPVRRWKTRLEAVRGSAREGALLRAADEARSSDWPYAARDFADAAVQRTQRPATRVDALRWLAMMEANLGRATEGTRLLTEARTLLQGKVGAAWTRLGVEVGLAEALAAAGKPSPEAVAAVSRALAYFQAAVPPLQHRLPQVLLVRARLQRALGRGPEARADLTAAIDVLVGMRAFVTPGVDEATLSDAARQVGDELVDLLAPTDEEAAFREIERLRAWDLPAAQRRDLPTLGAMRQALPASTVVADYVVGEHATYVWVVRRGSSTLIRIDADRRVLADLIAAARHAKGVGPADRLSTLLLEPLRKVVQPGDLIAVVPDGPLHLLPWASLHGFSRTYLIEEHPLLSAPSVSMLLSPASGPSRGLARVLAVGNPTFDRGLWPDLADLPAAAREAARVASEFPGSVDLSGTGATRSAVLAQLPRIDGVHVAAHGVINEFTPSASAVVLAGTDVLTAGEIRALPLTHLRLVVLASCDSARGYLPRSEGPLGLARAFLAAGAGAVVASLSSVNDTGSEALFREFYAKMRATGDVAAALRSAQIAALSSADPVQSHRSTWAQFVLTGSLASGASSFAALKE